MILTCPECATSYATAAGVIGAEGRKVKCRKCAHVWFATESDLSDSGQEIGDSSESRTENGQTSDQSSEDMTDSSDWGDAGISDLGDQNSDPDQDTDRSPGQGETDNADTGAPVGGYNNIVSGDRTGRLFLGANGEGRLGPIVSRIAAIAAAFVIVAGAVFFFRAQVVRMTPGSAQLFSAIGYPVNLRGLEFQNISFERGFEDGLPVLAIHGEVINITGKQLSLPKLRFALRDDQAQEIYHWTGAIGQDSLDPGQTVPFTTRLASPPVTARNIMVRFTGQAPG